MIRHFGQRAADLFARNHGLETVALEGFGATDSYAIGNLGPENARDAFRRIDRPEIEVLVVPGGNFPTMASISRRRKREFKKPARDHDEASFWAMLTRMPNRRQGSRSWPAGGAPHWVEPDEEARRRRAGL